MGSRFAGSAIVKNLGRLQAVCIGNIGCLIAAFSLSQLIYPCSHLAGEAEHAAEAAWEHLIFEKLTQAIVAVAIMTAVDTVLARARASTMATTRFLESLVAIDGGFQAAFAPRDAKGDLLEGHQLQARHTIDLSGKGDK